MTPMSVYGLIAATLKRLWLTILLSVVIFLIGLSRLALGVHFLQDVLVGWAFGLILLWLFTRFEGKITGWFGKRTFSQKITAVFAFSMAMLIVGALILVSLGDYEIPQSWQANGLQVFPGSGCSPQYRF